MDKPDFPIEGRGRSAKKRAAKEVEALAVRLVELRPSEIAKLPLSAPLAAELRLARSTEGHSSRKRQIKHLAGLLRHADEERAAIETVLAGCEVQEAYDRQAFHRLEELRDRLCDPAGSAAALAEVTQTWPEIDGEKLAALARSVHASGDKRAAREIFRRLRKVSEAE